MKIVIYFFRKVIIKRCNLIGNGYLFASNIGKYRKSEGPFCGTVPGTFPAGSYKRIRASLSYRRQDVNPAKVKKCACKQAKKSGYNFPSCGIEGKVKRSPRRGSPRRRKD
jgi:hypothetical protein